MPHTTRVTLRYPHGRSHQESLTTPDVLTLGSEFELYGHRWQAVEWVTSRSRYNRVPPSLIFEVSEQSGAATHARHAA